MPAAFDHVLLTRFSAVLAPGAPAPDPDWLWYRLQFFYDVTWPSVRSQTTRDFDWLVLLDDRCEEDFRANVEELAEGTFTPIWTHEPFTRTFFARPVAERRAVTRFTPLGVVGAITPWNFPILLAIWKIAPALVAGNTIVVKPSPFTPLTSLKLAEVVQDLLPPGVFSVLSGGDELGKAISSHPGIAKVAFTGSTETWRHVMASAADSIKRVTLELGGNDPAIVLPDVDPATVAPKLFWAAFQNNAQFCNATKRLYIHEDVYDQVRDALVAFAKTIKVGNGAEADTDLGPIQNAPQFAKVKEYFDDCKAKGYSFALGGDIDESQPGWFVPVTLVDNPPEDSRIVTEEPFGPILPLIKWRDEDDVVARANDTMWGLGATVWGKDDEATERIALQIEAGTVWINEVHQYSPHQAFGGHKQSGIGCENSIHGLQEYTNWQSVTRDKTGQV